MFIVGRYRDNYKRRVIIFKSYRLTRVCNKILLIIVRGRRMSTIPLFWETEESRNRSLRAHKTGQFLYTSIQSFHCTKRVNPPFFPAGIFSSEKLNAKFEFLPLAVQQLYIGMEDRTDAESHYILLQSLHFKNYYCFYGFAVKNILLYVLVSSNNAIILRMILSNIPMLTDGSF